MSILGNIGHHSCQAAATQSQNCRAWLEKYKVWKGGATPLAFYAAMAPKSCRSIRYLLLSWNPRQRNLQSENRSAVNCHLFVESSSFRTNSILGIFNGQFLWFSFMITSQYTFPICLLKVCWYFAQCQFLSIQERQASARSCRREMPTSAAMAIKVFQWYGATTKPFPITVFLTQRVFPKLGYPLVHYIYQRKNKHAKERQISCCYMKTYEWSQVSDCHGPLAAGYLQHAALGPIPSTTHHSRKKPTTPTVKKRGHGSQNDPVPVKHFVISFVLEFATRIIS